MEIPRAHHRHGEFHELGGLKADEANAQPTLGTESDMAERRHDDQQEHTAHIEPRRRTTEKVRIHTGEHEHRDGAEEDAHDRADDRRHALARGTVEDDESVDGDHRQAGHEWAVDFQRRQNAGRACQGTARARLRVDFFVNHVAGLRRGPSLLTVDCVCDGDCVSGAAGAGFGLMLGISPGGGGGLSLPSLSRR